MTLTSTAETRTGVEGERTRPSGDTSRPALVTRVIDGDTVEVRYRDGESDTIRLLGVDTPEVSGETNPDEFEGVPDTEAGREHLREWATRASAFARDRLEGREVQVVTDPRSDRRGRYGRLLAYVVASGENGSFNAALLRGGYARVYESSFTERERYERIETRARERGVGLWGFEGEEGNGRTSTSESKSTPRFAIARIQADGQPFPFAHRSSFTRAPGDDTERSGQGS